MKYFMKFHEIRFRQGWQSSNGKFGRKWVGVWERAAILSIYQIKLFLGVLVEWSKRVVMMRVVGVECGTEWGLGW
jgi:hypothetical protein